MDKKISTIINKTIREVFDEDAKVVADSIPTIVADSIPKIVTSSVPVKDNERCWFCNKIDSIDNMEFCWEFDTYLHRHCLKKAIEMDKSSPNGLNGELEIIKEEFGL